MPKYWGKSIFILGSFPEVGEKQKTEKKKKKNPKVCKNNGQLRIATPPQVAHAKPHVPKMVMLPNEITRKYTVGHSISINGPVSWGKSAIWLYNII